MDTASQLPTARTQFFDIVRSVTLRSGWISITPEPKQSVRFGQGRGYPDPKKQKYFKLLCNQIPTGKLICEPCELRVIYVFKGTSNDLRVGRSDWDNLTKPLQDALAGRAVSNDNRICLASVAKIQTSEDIEGIWWELATPLRVGPAILSVVNDLQKLTKKS